MTFAARISLLAVLLAEGVLTSRCAGQQTAYSHGDPTALEQHMLELINRARQNPAQEGIFLDSINTPFSQEARSRKPWFFTNLRTEFASYPAVPPLAFHPKLIQAARGHSADMLARNFFDHVNPSGQDPTARAAALGYDAGVGENISGAGATNAYEVLHSHFGLMVDYDNVDTAHPLGHRLNVLNATYTEAGMGFAGAYYGGRVTQDFSLPARAFILGVAYDDGNGNGAYDPGEGLPGISVRPDAGNWFAFTSASGGFAIPIDTVETVTDNVALPFPVNGTPWSVVEPYDTAYRRQQIQAAPSITVNLTWSGGALGSPLASSVALKRPVLRNYRLTGTDGWYYPRSMTTAQNAKADLIPGNIPPLPSGPRPHRDLNGDRIADLILQNSSGQILTWLLNGAGGVTGGFWIASGGLGDWQVVEMSDINRDGVADIILQNNAGQLLARILDGTGTGTGWAWISTQALGDWKVVGMTDVSGDTIRDLVLQNSAGLLLARLMDANGAAAGWKWIYSSGLGDWKVAATGDVNADGTEDLILQNSGGLIFSWLMNASGAISGGVWINQAGLGDWKVVAIFDLNRDGIGDLIFQDTAGQIAGWLMNGAGERTVGVTIFAGSLGDWRVR